MNECIPEVVQATRVTIKEADNGKLFSANITADASSGMNARGKHCSSQFGPLLEHCAFLVDGYVAGCTAATCASRNFPKEFPHYRRAGHGSVTRAQTQRGCTAFVHTRMCRVIGASGIHPGTMSSGKMEGDASDKNIASMRQGAEADGPYHRQEWEGTQPTTPILTGGMNALHLPPFCGQGPSDHPDLPRWLMDQELMKVGMEIRDKIMDSPFRNLTAPGGFSTPSHDYKEFVDKGDTNEFINDKLATASINENVDKLMKAGTEIRDKTMDLPFQDSPDASLAGRQETYLNVSGYATMEFRASWPSNLLTRF